jgi:hypothetical protein
MYFSFLSWVLHTLLIPPSLVLSSLHYLTRSTNLGVSHNTIFFFQSYLTSSLVSTNILFRTLGLNVLSQCQRPGFTPIYRNYSNWRTRFLYLIPLVIVSQLYLQAPGSLFAAFCNPQGYGGGSLTPPPHGRLLRPVTGYRRTDKKKQGY